MQSIAALRSEHCRDHFQCGNDLLDRYIQQQARQDAKRGLSACFVMADQEDRVLGYYTLSACSDTKDNFPEDLAKKLPPSYHHLPSTLLGRLACDNSIKGKGFGEILLMDALLRAIQTTHSVASLAVVVDPVDENARKFYQKYEFIGFKNSSRMFLPMKTIADLFKEILDKNPTTY